MPNHVETAAGQCPTHGDVEGTREVPRLGFPPLIAIIRRAIARRRPYRCPECGAAVTTG
jgi:hypothetical protein